jgi:hypothetical protein
LTFDFNMPVIETYQQLMGLLVVLAGAFTLCRLLWLQFRANIRFVSLGAVRQSESRLMAAEPKAQMPRETTPSARIRDADRREFDKLATMISTVSTRAEQVSETQNKAAQKIDTVEMAMHRMLADIDGIMVVPRAEIAASAAHTSVSAAPRASRAA